MALASYNSQGNHRSLDLKVAWMVVKKQQGSRFGALTSYTWHLFSCCQWVWFWPYHSTCEGSWPDIATDWSLSSSLLQNIGEHLYQCWYHYHHLSPHPVNWTFRPSTIWCCIHNIIYYPSHYHHKGTKLSIELVKTFLQFRGRGWLGDQIISITSWS